MLLAVSLPALPAIASDRAAPARKVYPPGYAPEPPPSSKIEAGREISISEYRSAQFSDENGELRSCQLKSATVIFLKADDKYALFQVKVSGNIASNKMQPCQDGIKVAMFLAQFDDMLRYDDGKARRASEAERAKNSLQDLLKK